VQLFASNKYFQVYRLALFLSTCLLSCYLTLLICGTLMLNIEISRTIVIKVLLDQWFSTAGPLTGTSSCRYFAGPQSNLHFPSSNRKWLALMLNSVKSWSMTCGLRLNGLDSSVLFRGASRGSVWLSWQALLYCRYSAWKPIKYQRLSLQVSNANGLEQATVCISLLTLHSTVMKQRPCLV